MEKKKLLPLCTRCGTFYTDRKIDLCDYCLREIFQIENKIYEDEYENRILYLDDVMDMLVKIRKGVLP